MQSVNLVIKDGRVVMGIDPPLVLRLIDQILVEAGDDRTAHVHLLDALSSLAMALGYVLACLPEHAERVSVQGFLNAAKTNCDAMRVQFATGPVEQRPYFFNGMTAEKVN